MAKAYSSFVQQIDDAQHTPSTMSKWFNATPGSVPDTVPFYGHGQSVCLSVCKQAREPVPNLLENTGGLLRPPAL